MRILSLVLALTWRTAASAEPKAVMPGSRNLSDGVEQA